MKRFIPYILLLALAITVQGCRTKASSRTYDARFDRTWAAVLKVTHKMTGRNPVVQDEMKGKIVTAWVNGDTEGLGNGVTGKHLQIWRGVINCKVLDGGGTRVSISLEKGSAQTRTFDSDPDRHEGNIGVELWPEKDESQKKFLDEVGEELANGSHHHSR